MLNPEWGRTDTRNTGFLPRAAALHMVIASAAAVASSSRLAPEIWPTAQALKHEKTQDKYIVRLILVGMRH